jgi:predicted oxidoreductase
MTPKQFPVCNNTEPSTTQPQKQTQLNQEEKAHSLVDSTTRKLGIFECTPLAFGMWRSVTANVAEAQRVLEVALNAGMNLIDTANVYGMNHGGRGFGTVEEILGQVLKVSPGLRDRMILVTKGGIIPGVPYDSSPEALRKACEESLQRLGVETIDIYLIHRPDQFTHPASVADTLVELQKEGKIREFGVSNYTAAQYDALSSELAKRGATLVTNQVEFSAKCTTPMIDGTFECCYRHRITPMAWSPLAKGAIISDTESALVEQLDLLASREGVSRAAIALAFVLSHPSRPVTIIGSQNEKNIIDATTALKVKLDRKDIYCVLRATGMNLP